MRRIGVAISDVTRTLARPVGVLHTTSLDAAAVHVTAEEVKRLGREEDGVASIVIGLPRRLDGSDNEMTPLVKHFAAQLEIEAGLPTVLQDEGLTSRAAEDRLALRVKDWRERKKLLDAAAAAVILQDYLDTHAARQAVHDDD
jgi:putative holliday junction resolvase